MDRLEEMVKLPSNATHPAASCGITRGDAHNEGGTQHRTGLLGRACAPSASMASARNVKQDI